MVNKTRLLCITILKLEKPLGIRLNFARKIVANLVGHDRYFRYMIHCGDTTNYDDPDYFDKRDLSVDRSEFHDVYSTLSSEFPVAKKVLEVGCGTGLLSKYLQDMGYATHSCDVDKRALEYCKERGLECSYQDITNLQFGDRTFDVTVSQHVIEHCYPTRKAIEECLRVSKYGCVHIVPGHQSTDTTHVIPFFTDEIIRNVFAGLDYSFKPDTHSTKYPNDLDFVIIIKKN